MTTPCWNRLLPLFALLEGIAAQVDGDTLDLLMVTDADDRQTHALLLSATLTMRSSQAR